MKKSDTPSQSQRELEELRKAVETRILLLEVQTDTQRYRKWTMQILSEITSQVKENALSIEDLRKGLSVEDEEEAEDQEE